MHRILAILLLFLSIPSVAAAQIDLPDRPVKAAKPEKTRKPVALPKPDLGDLAEKVVGRPAGERGGLPEGVDLPGRGVRAPTSNAGRAAGADVRPPPASPALAQAAAFIFDEVAKARGHDEAVVLQAAASLANLGDSGLDAARARMVSEHGPTLVVAARVLLASGAAADGELVARRMRGRVPRGAAGELLAAMVQLDPVRASPELFAELLAHRQTVVRAAAHKQLAELPEAELVLVLPSALSARTSDARLRAVQLAARLEHPGALELLLSRLADPTAEVARRALEALAARDDERVAPALFERAFSGPWILRENAYAVLALVEREDARLEPLLSSPHVDALLGGLSSSDAFVAGVCAAALAGVGFRLPAGAREDVDAWLDRDVPRRLVRTVSGGDFHNDFSSLLPTALRRLALIGGAQHGTDGGAWVSWWRAVEPDFQALRAVLPALPEQAAELSLAFLSSVDGGEGFVLVGPSPAAREHAAAFGQVLHLSAGQVGELFEVLRQEGVFEAVRLPGTRARGGTGGGGERTLEVAIGDRSKVFRFPEGVSEDWFERVVASGRALASRNRWQLYPEPGLERTALDAFEREADWWAAERPALERARRLKERVLRALAVRPLDEREQGLEELESLAAVPGCLAGEDLDALASLMSEERFLGPRARRELELARAALELLEEAGAPAGRLASEPGDRLIDTLVETFGPTAARELSELLSGYGRDAARRACVDARPLLRAVAASLLAQDPLAEDLERLRSLLGDEMQAVEVATVLAVGDARLDALRTEVLVRARVGATDVRCAALRAAGRLGGDNVLDVLVLGLSERDDADVVLAAAEGLAALADPSTASLFVSMLSRGADDPLIEPARVGLLALGEQAFSELTRAMESPASRARREAALILARQGAARAVPVLVRLLAEDPGDLRVALELAVQSGVDLRGERDPASAWWTWWEGVVHDDPLAWLFGALERGGRSTPGPDSVRGEGTYEGAVFLATLIAEAEPHHAERARRELSRLLGRELRPPMVAGPGLEAWDAELHLSLEQRYK